MDGIGAAQSVMSGELAGGLFDLGAEFDWSDAGPELHPVPGRVLDASTLLERWRRLPHVDPVRLRSDIDDVMDPYL